MTSRKIALPILMVLFIGMGSAHAQAVVPTTLPALDAAFEGFEVFMTDLNDEVNALIVSIDSIELAIDDIVNTLDSIALSITNFEDRITSLESGAGASTYNTIVRNETITTNSVKQFIVDCAIGDKVVSGGYGDIPFTSPSVTESYPLDEDTWVVRVNNPLPFDLDMTVRVLCVTP